MDELSTEADLLSEEIMERQKHMLAMEASGARAFTDPTDISDACTDYLAKLSSGEAQFLLREYLILAVKSKCELAQTRVRSMDTEMQLKENSALLRSYLSRGVSRTDVQPLSPAKEDDVTDEVPTPTEGVPTIVVSSPAVAGDAALGIVGEGPKKQTPGSSASPRTTGRVPRTTARATKVCRLCDAHISTQPRPSPHTSYPHPRTHTLLIPMLTYPHIHPCTHTHPLEECAL